MKYRIHDEVVCESIGGLYFLIAYGQAKNDLGFMTAINDTGAFYWDLLERGLDSEKIMSLASEEFEIPKEMIRTGVEYFLSDLVGKGYIMPML